MQKEKSLRWKFLLSHTHTKTPIIFVDPAKRTAYDCHMDGTFSKIKDPQQMDTERRDREREKENSFSGAFRTAKGFRTDRIVFSFALAVSFCGWYLQFYHRTSVSLNIIFSKRFVLFLHCNVNTDIQLSSKLVS